MNELLKYTAFEATRLLANGDVTPLELVEVSTERISEVEPDINALPTLCIERAMDQAKELTRQGPIDKPNARGWLAGLPISIKDLTETAGVRTTFGSPIYADYIPTASDILVKQLEFRGAIVMGKSNTPEFGAGASTFNEVFGVTKNPWNTSKSVAGSSGGACASVATGEVWLSTGSDLGGSLRTPASFNSVVGLRPTPGCIPKDPKFQPFDALHVQGPIARNAEDTALFLDALAGHHPVSPLSHHAPKEPYLEFIRNPNIPRKIGYSSDLGITTVEPEVDEICRKAVLKYESFKTGIDEACSNFSGAIDSFNVLRAANFVKNLIHEYRSNRDLLKPEIVWNIEQGMDLTIEDICQAERTQARIFRSMIKFFDRYDLLVCPCAIVPPFDVDVRFVEQVGENIFDTYFEWIAITFAITLTGCPAISIPAGFTQDGLPVGLQIIAPPRDEGSLLSAAYLMEQVTDFTTQLPIDPINTHEIKIKN